MCLETERNFHRKDGDDMVHARVAECDILVWKRLNLVMGVARSPFLHHRYTFGKLETAPLARTEVIARDWNYDYSKRIMHGYARLNEGLHAVRKRDTRAWIRKGNRTYPAVIPKGSMIYIGQQDDIVSNKLIVYKNLTELAKVHGKPQKEGVKISKATQPTRMRVPR